MWLLIPLLLSLQHGSQPGSLHGYSSSSVLFGVLAARKNCGGPCTHVQGPGTSTAQSEELRVAAARLLAAQAMVREDLMAGAAKHGPVAGWPSPSTYSSSDDVILPPPLSKR